MIEEAMQLRKETDERITVAEYPYQNEDDPLYGPNSDLEKDYS
jgi:hypothetical protein